MNKYYLLKVDTNKRVNNEAYFDLLSEKYIELTEKEIASLGVDIALTSIIDANELNDGLKGIKLKIGALLND